MAVTAAAQDPIRVGVLTGELGVGAAESASPNEAGVVVGARFALAARGRASGSAAVPTIELVVETCTDAASASAAVARLDAAGVIALIAPLAPQLQGPVQRAARGKFVSVAHAPQLGDVITTIDSLFADKLLLSQIGLARDEAREARELQKLLEKGGLKPPHVLLADYSMRDAQKQLTKEFAKSGQPEIVIVDADPDAAATFLKNGLAGTGIPAVLTPRAFGAATRAVEGVEMFVVLGQSPATRASTGSFREDWERQHGPTIGFGVAEGFEAMQMIARAVDAASDATSRDEVARLVRGGGVAEGARGRQAFDQKLDAVPSPLAVWRMPGGGAAAVPYSPAVLAIEVAAQGTAAAERQPDANLGEPFGTWRTRQFQLDAGDQWVVCRWGEKEGKDIDDDLAELGLSTRGAVPLLDRIVKDELMARILAITSSKFGRNTDGTAVPGKSLRISFATFAPEKKRRMWPAYFAGDDEGAGGRAFGTYCEIYTTFIRRTIFQPHALTPPLEASDMDYVDGTYRFGTDHLLDKRSELIRALINGYAGSMALTTAHEVGHLCGLGHITDDPRGIMNVDEGAGLDYRDAHFSVGSWAKLVETLGLSEPASEAGAKRR